MQFLFRKEAQDQTRAKAGWKRWPPAALDRQFTVHLLYQSERFLAVQKGKQISWFSEILGKNLLQDAKNVFAHDFGNVFFTPARFF